MRGHTLIELTVVLVLGVITLHVAVGEIRPWLHRWSVLAAREEFVGLVSRARARGIGNGGAVVHVGGSATWARAGGWIDSLRLRHEVHLRVVGSSGDVELRFDALGLGRVASRRIRFVLRDSSADLVLSSYGRLRRE